MFSLVICFRCWTMEQGQWTIDLLVSPATSVEHISVFAPYSLFLTFCSIVHKQKPPSDTCQTALYCATLASPCFFRFSTDKLHSTMPHRLYGKQIRECLLSCLLFLEAVCMTPNAGRSSDSVHLLRLPIRTNILQWLLQQTHIFAFFLQIPLHTQILCKYFCIPTLQISLHTFCKLCKPYSSGTVRAFHPIPF